MKKLFHITFFLVVASLVLVNQTKSSAFVSWDEFKKSQLNQPSPKDFNGDPDLAFLQGSSFSSFRDADGRVASRSSYWHSNSDPSQAATSMEIDGESLPIVTDMEIN